MASSPLRYKRLIQALPKHKYKVKPAAIEAGFTEKTADQQGKRLINSALKWQANELAKEVNSRGMVPTNEAKRTMAEIVGLSNEDLMKQLLFIATQTRDLNSALKVLAPLAKEHGVILQDDDAKNTVTVPILNVTVKDKTALPSPIIEVAP